jgi:hypothetical protein
MPRDDDPRVVIRLTPEDLAAIRAAAAVGDVAVGALVRECAVRYASTVARELRVSGKRVRRGNVSKPEPAVPARSVPKPKSEPAPPIAGLKRASELVPGQDAKAWALARQAKLNEARDRGAPVKKGRGS